MLQTVPAQDLLPVDPVTGCLHLAHNLFEGSVHTGFSEALLVQEGTARTDALGEGLVFHMDFLDVAVHTDSLEVGLAEESA